MVISYKKSLLFLMLCVVLPAFSQGLTVFALDTANSSSKRENLWVGPGAEIAMYSISGAAFGGSLAIGYGNGAAIGLKTAYLINADGKITTLELNFLLRLYFHGKVSCSGPFIQLNGGPVFFADDSSLSLPSGLGAVSAGASSGWRFLMGQYFYVEPAIRVGYPYIAGIVLSGGIHF